MRRDPPRALRHPPAVSAAGKNAHGHTVDRIGEAIVAGRYAVGSTLPPEPLLCDELGVSRTVVREAVKSLTAKGLLVAGPKVGTRVLPSDNWNWFDPDVVAAFHEVTFEEWADIRRRANELSILRGETQWQALSDVVKERVGK